MENLHVLAFLMLIFSFENLPSTMHAHVTLCGQTTYPQICNSLINSNVLPSSQEIHLDIRNTALKITLDHARKLHGVISSFDFSSFEKLPRVVWADCLELYEDTIHQLNLTILYKHSSMTMDDIQTYLSAAKTNHETCQNGFVDLNVSTNSELFTSKLSKFTSMLTSTLAINGAFLSSTSSTFPYTWKDRGGVIGGWGGGGGDRVPSWMSKAKHKLLHSPNSNKRANLVVAKDGSGDYKTISEAIVASKHLRNQRKRTIIYIKEGIYRENVVVSKEMSNLMLIGDGIDVTIVSGKNNVQDGTTTYRSATFGISGNGFIAKDITFENTAGPQKHQAVAMRSGSDFSIFYHCSFRGYQDTLYVHSKRQFYKECDIYGTVDFIFGNAAVVFQNCNIYARKPMDKQINTITAQGRADPNENTGIVIHDSIIEAAADLKPVQGLIQTFLGRPWKMYSRTMIMKSYIDGLVDPAGWAPWNGDFAIETLYYGEYMNIGVGSDTRDRVKWPGYHNIRSPIEAGKFTVEKFLGGDKWIPITRVPFTSGL